jgi:gliding motility-associated-like protein
VLTPSFQNITCTALAVTDITASASPTVNIEHNWISPAGTTLVANSPVSGYPPGGPGTYTHCVINKVNGCSSCKTFTVASNDAFPTFSVTSPQSFTLGCNTKSVATINIVNANTTPPGGSISYTLVAPGANQPGSGTLSSVSSYTAFIPGTYTAITQDNSNACRTKVYFSVLLNNFGPSIDTVVIPRNVLNCYFPNVILEGLSGTPNVSYSWQFPGTPGSVPGSTINVISNTATPTNTLLANFTLNIVDNSNTCRTTTVVPIYQNLFKPIAAITGANAITCVTETITLSNGSSSSIPPGGFFPRDLPVIVAEWHGPAPQQPLQVSSTYVAYMPGTYTMVAKDLNNGCTSVATKTVIDYREFPFVNRPNPPSPFVLDCGTTSVKISPIITSTAPAFSYSWSAVNQATFSGQDTPTLTTNTPGEYEIIVTNLANGCASQAFVTVVNGELKAGFVPDKIFGYAPLAVTFSNTTTSTTGNASIVTIWTYGNGTTGTTTLTTESPEVTYTQAGSYTVTLFAHKGSCVDTAVRYINVELPSSLQIPNIFTPNNDGSNDLFFLKTANLAHIEMSIVDRWGHKVYELTSEKGNVEWDGKNQYGREVPDGVYYYVLKATGKDGQEYDLKGNITVTR